jgi:hypothetical protein
MKGNQVTLRPGKNYIHAKLSLDVRLPLDKVINGYQAILRQGNQ